MLLASWIAVCCVVAVVLLNRPAARVAVALGLSLAIPSIASEAVTGVPLAAGGGVPPLHPASWFIVVSLLAELLLGGGRLQRSVRDSKGIVFAVCAGVALAAASTLTGYQHGGLSLLINQVLCPFLLYIQVHVAVTANDTNRLWLTRVWIIGAVSVVLVAAAVHMGLLTQPFAEYFERYYWYQFEAGERAHGTLDHPLTLSVVLASTIPLLATVRSTSLQLLMAVVLGYGILLTESRTGFVLGALALAYISIASHGAIAKLLGLTLIAIAIVPMLSGDLDRITGKFSADGGSAEARFAALGHFVEELPSFVLFGQGTGANYSLAREWGLTTSLENGLLMFVVDYGLLATVLMIAPIVAALVARSGREQQPYKLAVALGLASWASYSSIATESAAGIVVWFMVGLATPTATPQDLKTTVPEPDSRKLNLSHG